MADTNSVSLFHWGFRGWLIALLALPGLGMIAAGLLVSPDALTDDGMPLGTFLLAIGAFWLLTDATVVLVFLLVNRRRRSLAVNGLDGTAVIVSVEETGTLINGIPLLRFVLRVNDGYRPEREVVHRATIPFTAIPRLQPGVTVRVKVHRENPDRLLILHGA
jgi:hypothetical protein